MHSDEKIESKPTYHSNENLSFDNGAIFNKIKRITLCTKNSKEKKYLKQESIEIKNQGNIFEPKKMKSIKIETSNNKTFMKHFLREDLYRELFILFINPISGVHAGKSLLEMDIKEIKFDELGMMVFVVNLRDNVKVDEVLTKLEEFHLNSLNKTRIIIGGGDGSAMSILDKFLKRKIDFTRCAFGILPLGNSNNFSQTLGFKGKKKIIIRW